MRRLMLFAVFGLGGLACGPSDTVDVNAPMIGPISPARPDARPVSPPIDPAGSEPGPAVPSPGAGSSGVDASAGASTDAVAGTPASGPGNADASAPPTEAGSDRPVPPSSPPPPPSDPVDVAPAPDLAPPSIEVSPVDARAPDAAPRDLPPVRDVAGDTAVVQGPIETMACLPKPAADEVISTFEDGSLGSPMVGTRGGSSWYLLNSMDASVTISNVEQPVRCGSRRALRFAGMAAEGTTPIARLLFRSIASFYDARAYKGVRFSLRAGVLSRVRFKLPDKNTSSSGGVCTNCSAHFGRDMDIGTEWTSVQVPFSSLTQSGVGDPQPAVTPASLLGIEFVVRGLPVFELFVDDVSFYR